MTVENEKNSQLGILFSQQGSDAVSSSSDHDPPDEMEYDKKDGDDESELGYLYVMVEDGRKHIKIGISKSTPKREQQLNRTTMPMTVRLIGQVRTPHYKEAERILHRLYSPRRVKGEWFDLDPIETACLMLLTPSHIEELIYNRKTPMLSLTELVKGAMETFMNPGDSYFELNQQRRERMVESLNRVNRDLKAQIRKLELDLSTVKMTQMGVEEKTESMVRNALRALPERYGSSHQSVPPSW